MSISLPWWWLILSPLAFFPPIYILRRLRIGAWLSIGVTISLASLALMVPRGELIRLFGWPIVYDDISAYTLVLLFGSTACLCTLSLLIPQGWTFYPFSHLILALLTLALLIRHIGLIAMLVNIAALLSVFIIQGGRLGSVRAAFRFVVMMTLAVPIFLLAAWYLDQQRLFIRNQDYINQTTFLVGFGFALWLGLTPFHGWISAIAAEAKPGITAFICITFPSVVVITLFHLLATSSWLTDHALSLRIVLLAGVVTAGLGGFFASVQPTFGSLTGYATIFDLGLMIVALGLGTSSAFIIIIFSLITRGLGLLLIAISRALLQTQTGGDSFVEVRGLGKQFPLATLGLTIGGLTLVGVPFTAGFVSRWTLLQALVMFNPTWSIIILLASLGVAFGYLRGLHALMDTGSTATQTKGYPQSLAPFIVCLAILCCGLGLFPQPLLRLAQYLVVSLDIPIL